MVSGVAVRVLSGGSEGISQPIDAQLPHKASRVGFAAPSNPLVMWPSVQAGAGRGEGGHPLGHQWRSAEGERWIASGQLPSPPLCSICQIDFPRMFCELLGPPIPIWVTPAALVVCIQAGFMKANVHGIWQEAKRGLVGLQKSHWAATTSKMLYSIRNGPVHIARGGPGAVGHGSVGPELDIIWCCLICVGRRCDTKAKPYTGNVVTGVQASQEGAGGASDADLAELQEEFAHRLGAADSTIARLKVALNLKPYIYVFQIWHSYLNVD